MVEDDVVLRDMFVEYFELFDELKLVGLSGDGHTAMQECLSLKPDVIILDIRLPEVSGLEMLVLLRRKIPNAKILFFTGSLTPQTVRMAMECNADAFVEKAFGLEELKKAIDKVLKGEKHFSSGASEMRKRIAGH
jgi:DNA-binding NarL/FixJ family response regulator